MDNMHMSSWNMILSLLSPNRLPRGICSQGARSDREFMTHRLTADDLVCFAQDGFLVVEDVLGADDLAPIRHACDACLDRTTRHLFDVGAIPETCPGLNFGERFVRLSTKTSKSPCALC